MSKGSGRTDDFRQATNWVPNKPTVGSQHMLYQREAIRPPTEQASFGCQPVGIQIGINPVTLGWLGDFLSHEAVSTSERMWPIYLAQPLTWPTEQFWCSPITVLRAASSVQHHVRDIQSRTTAIPRTAHSNRMNEGRSMPALLHFVGLMYLVRRNLNADQSSSIATMRTLSNPAARSTSQPESRLNSHVYRFELFFG